MAAYWDEAAMQRALVAAGDPAHLLIVDSRGTLAEKDWANELHPKGKGFKKIAKERWKPVLKGAGLA